MYQEERLYQILALLRKRGFLKKGDIMAMFNISRDTARRDIIALTERKLAQRTYGGIALPQGAPPDLFKVRHEHDVREKYQLGRLATAYIRKDNKIFLDTSTTVESICQHLHQAVQVYTNSIDIVDILQNNPSIEAHLVGGRLHRAYRYLYGEETIHNIKEQWYDICFLGATSITENGVYTYEEEEAKIKRSVVGRSSLVCVLVSTKKFLNQPHAKFCDLQDVDVILTSAIPPKSILRALAEANCSIVWDVHKEK